MFVYQWNHIIHVNIVFVLTLWIVMRFLLVCFFLNYFSDWMVGYGSVLCTSGDQTLKCNCFSHAVFYSSLKEFKLTISYFNCCAPLIIQSVGLCHFQDLFWIISVLFNFCTIFCLVIDKNLCFLSIPVNSLYIHYGAALWKFAYYNWLIYFWINSLSLK